VCNFPDDDTAMVQVGQARTRQGGPGTAAGAGRPCALSQLLPACPRCAPLESNARTLPPPQDSNCSAFSYLSHSYGSYSSSPLGSTPPIYGSSPGGYSPSPGSATALQHMANAAAALYGKSNLGGRASSEDKEEAQEAAEEAADMNVDDELAEMADALLLLHESA
jgi:hypothetical protein